MSSLADEAVAEPAPIDLRIVVDGASTAGKTTTARALAQRLGRPVVTAGEEEGSGRTLLFDWLDHVGGRRDGRAIRTQVVAVPGHLPHLRARLLITADVVLFVADTSADGIDAAARALVQVRRFLDALPDPAPELLVQANKRDRSDALPIEEVRARLDLDDEDLLIETVATEGEGVQQSFVFAVRLALRHVIAGGADRTAVRQRTADALLAELDLDPTPVAPPRASTRPEPEPDPEPEPEPVVAAGRVAAERRDERPAWRRWWDRLG